MVGPMGKGKQLLHKLHVHALLIGSHFQHGIVQVVGEAQVVVLNWIALLT